MPLGMQGPRKNLKLRRRRGDPAVIEVEKGCPLLTSYVPLQHSQQMDPEVYKEKQCSRQIQINNILTNSWIIFLNTDIRHQNVKVTSNKCYMRS